MYPMTHTRSIATKFWLRKTPEDNPRWSQLMDKCDQEIKPDLIVTGLVNSWWVCTLRVDQLPPQELATSGSAASSGTDRLVEGQPYS